MTLPLARVFPLSRTAWVTRAIKEVQSLRTVMLPGALAGVKIDVPELRQFDVLTAAIDFDMVGNAIIDLGNSPSIGVSIADIRAIVSIAFAGVLDGDQVSVGQSTITFRDTPKLGLDLTRTFTEAAIGGSDVETAESFAQQLNRLQGRSAPSPFLAPVDPIDLQRVFATFFGSASPVVRAAFEGTTGNGISVVENTGGARITPSASTLTGGSDVGGINITVDTENVWLQYYKMPTGDDSSG